MRPNSTLSRPLDAPCCCCCWAGLFVAVAAAAGATPVPVRAPVGLSGCCVPSWRVTAAGWLLLLRSKASISSRSSSSSATPAACASPAAADAAAPEGAAAAAADCPVRRGRALACPARRRVPGELPGRGGDAPGELISNAANTSSSTPRASSKQGQAAEQPLMK